MEGEETGGGGGLEDKFLNIEEMKKFMEEDEAREYGLDKKKQGKKKMAKGYDDDDDEVEEKDKEGDDDDDELGDLGLTGEEDTSDVENVRYEDFFVSKKKLDQKKKPKVIEDADKSDDEEDEDSDMGDEQSDDKESDDKMKMDNLSTYEKQLLKQHAKIKEVERENLETKSWTMQGEVTAAKRPKNSALEVELDWERNAKPPPVITEEVSQSIEELILKRISEDENKSKKGLCDIYADEYA